MPQQPDRRKQPRDPDWSDPQEFVMDTRRNSGNRRANSAKGVSASSQEGNSRGSSDPRRATTESGRSRSQTPRSGNGARPIPVRGKNDDPRRDGRPREAPRRAPRPGNDDTARFETPRFGQARPHDSRAARPERRAPRTGVRPNDARTGGPDSGGGEHRAPGRRRLGNERPTGAFGDDIRFDEASGTYVSGSTTPQKQRPRPARPLRGARLNESPRDPRTARRGVRVPPSRPSSKPGGASPITGDGDDGGAGSGEGTGGTKRKFGRGKKIIAGFLVLVLLWFACLIWAGTSAWDKVTKVDAIPAHTASKGSGTNILLVGSDGREGLTKAQKRALGTGDAEGQRTDSIMVLHIGGPKPTLMSIPRDSYVAIPGYGKNKINAAFSIGGPKLLIKTVEQDTGIYIDNYMEIGFGGFASVVDAVGGVHICVAFNMNDKKAHINLKKGCQTLNGANALGYVRARYSDPEGDIGRAKRQRQFLGALMKKISSPTNLLFPWKLKGLGESGAQGLSVDNGMSIFTAARAMWTLKGLSGSNGNSVSVPLDNTALYTPVGDAVEWDPNKSAALFKAIRDNDSTTPFVIKSTPAAKN